MALLREHAHNPIYSRLRPDADTRARKLFAVREQAGMKHFFVEHDNPAEPLSSVRTSYRYLDSLEF